MLNNEKMSYKWNWINLC